MRGTRFRRPGGLVAIAFGIVLLLQGSAAWGLQEPEPSPTPEPTETVAPAESREAAASSEGDGGSAQQGASGTETETGLGAGDAATEDAAPSARPVAARRSTAALQGSASVAMEDNVFVPATLTVDPGTEVTWNNTGENPHTSTSNDGVWDSGLVQPGGSFAFTFEDPGSYPYFCEVHGQSMSGVIEVRGTTEGPGGGGGGEQPEETGGTTQTGAAETPSGDALPATGPERIYLALVGVALIALGGWLARRRTA